MLPKALGPQTMSNIIHLHQYVMIIDIFQLRPSGQTKIEEARIHTATHTIHTIIHDALETEVAKPPPHTDL